MKQIGPHMMLFIFKLVHLDSEDDPRFFYTIHLICGHPRPLRGPHSLFPCDAQAACTSPPLSSCRAAAGWHTDGGAGGGRGGKFDTSIWN